MPTDLRTALTNAYNIALQDRTSASVANYYSVLQASNLEDGKVYGDLARGVVLNTGFAGILANNYAENKIINDKGLSSGYSPEKQLELKINLMTRDFEARDQADFQDITGFAISQYHNAAHRQVFPTLPGAEEAWTAYHIVEALQNEPNRYDIWMVNGSSDYANLAWKMEKATLPWVGSTEAQTHANIWFQDMLSGPRINTVTGTLENGDGVLARTTVEFLVQSGQDALKHTYELLSDALSASGGAADNPFFAEAEQLSLFSHIGRLEDGIGSSEDMRAINGAVDIAPVLLAPSDAPASTIGIDLLKLGIKYDLAGRDLDAAKAPPAELVSTFQTIDAFTPDRVLAAAAGGRGTAMGTDAADLYLGGAGNDILLGGDGSDWLVSTAG